MGAVRLIVLGLAFWVAPLNSLAAMPGAELSAWQSMQGQWQRHCYPSVDGSTRVYRRDFLVVGFTEFKLNTKVYSDDTCRHVRTEYSSVFQYVLSGSYFRDAGGKKIFAIDVTAKAISPDLLRIPVLNIMAVRTGRLYFGRDYSGQAERGERLTQLDVKQPFLRH